MQKEVFVGNIVYSKAGRDAGKCYIIVKLDEKGYAYVANGEERQLANPKRKNIKHLNLACEAMCDGIAEKLLAGRQVFDSEIRSAIRSAVGE